MSQTPTTSDDGYVNRPEFVATDDDLPGQWSLSDFTGGDPDERSYTERGWIPESYVEPDNDLAQLERDDEAAMQEAWSEQQAAADWPKEEF